MKQRSLFVYCKGVWLFLLLTFLLASCASTRKSPSEDPIIGKWDGIGLFGDMHAIFEEDGKFRLFDVTDGKEKDFAFGKWKHFLGKYSLIADASDENPDRVGKINADGELLVRYVGEPSDLAVTFRRNGAKPPEAKPASPPPQGEWRYAYTSKSSIPANSPSPFDIMDFTGDGKVKLRISAMGRDFSQECRISDKVITVVTGESRMPEMNFKYRWEDNGEKLVLSIADAENSPFSMEWTYLRPDQFLPTDITGTWTGDLPEVKMKEEVTLAGDGYFARSVIDRDGKVVHRNNMQVKDYYRLWKAPFGNAITLVVNDPEMASQLTQMFRYEKNGNEMRLSPVELTEGGKLKVHKEDNIIWKLQDAK